MCGEAGSLESATEEDISFAPDGRSVDADVVVIGAGAAGLAAARRAAEHSLRVILVEARDRVGGRVWSQVVTRLATPAELGAEFIHGQAAETTALLREIGTAAIDTAGDSWLVRDGELRRDESDFLSSASLFEEARALGRDETVAAFLERFVSDPQKRETANAARVFVEGFEAADPKIASVRAIAEEIHSGVDYTSARPLGGYRAMVERLRDACVGQGVHIMLSTIVRRIVWSRGSVCVEINAAEKRTLRARAAVITLPVGVLRERDNRSGVEFDPDMPQEKRDALAGLEMGHAFKVVLWFRAAFWEQIRDGIFREAAFFRPDDDAFAAYWTQYPVRAELVSAWAGGPKADALRGVSREDLIARALDGFDRILGEQTLAKDHFAGGVVHDWSGDPFARGAYSYVAVGAENARAKLATPVDGTLFFAGEATSTDGQGGTVNGAIETGERAVAEVLAAR